MNSVKCEIKKLVIPTYPEPAAEEMPMFAENRVHQRTSGRPYPNKVVLKVNREEKIDKEYTAVVLENEYLKIEILPEIGGIIPITVLSRVDFPFPLAPITPNFCPLLIRKFTSLNTSLYPNFKFLTSSRAVIGVPIWYRAHHAPPRL